MQGTLRKKQDVLKANEINRNNGQRKTWEQQLEEIRTNWVLETEACFEGSFSSSSQALRSEGCCIDQSERHFRREPTPAPDFTRG